MHIVLILVSEIEHCRNDRYYYYYYYNTVTSVPSHSPHELRQQR